MANPRCRKRVFAQRRGPDGSAFQRCDVCGVSVAIALRDMHECNLKRTVVERLKDSDEGGRGIEPIVIDQDESDLERPVKRLKGCGRDASLSIEPCFENQPRSAFCIFMESFRKSYKVEEWMEADRKGLETWKSMSDQEKGPFVLPAKLVNMACEAALLEEAEDLRKLKVDDEADSGTVGNFYLHFEDWEDSE